MRTLQQAGSSETAILHLIANHHAYLDDSGYPKEARGEFTSDRTRILMIVDRYDELLVDSEGPHRCLRTERFNGSTKKLDRISSISSFYHHLLG